jgi:ribosome-associated protein
MQQIDFYLRGGYITLDNLLKATGATSSGATAKQSVAGGLVSVDGQQELRKTAKIRAGQLVQFSAGSQSLHIRVLPEVDDSTSGLP